LADAQAMKERTKIATSTKGTVRSHGHDGQPLKSAGFTEVCRVFLNPYPFLEFVYTLHCALIPVGSLQ
jgi:hypothetical protein